MTEEKKAEFKWSDGETWTTTVIGGKKECQWVIVEFLLKSGELYPDPYIKMEFECVAWKEEYKTTNLIGDCNNGLRRLDPNSQKTDYCHWAVWSGITRLEDIIKYGEVV